MPLPDELVTRFDDCLDKAVKEGELEPTAMCLSTLSETGGVSSRMVLLKHHDRDGFVFYTNLGSIKGQQLQACDAAALAFHWKLTECQVRIEGQAILVSDAEADAYFGSRPRGSQLGAWASKQSQDMAGRAELVKRLAGTEAQFFGGKVSRPPFWSGYRVEPRMIEFWYGRKSRLHDRYRFTYGEQGWQERRLFP